VFALTDSLVKVSPMAQLRLENYLFTVESIARAWSVLDDGGQLVFYNYYREPWLVEKLELAIGEATGVSARRLAMDGNFACLVVTKGDQTPPPARGADSQPLPRDDWPFLYLRDKAVPAPYLWAMALLTLGVIALLVVLQRWAPPAQSGARPAGLAIKLAFLLMGVAFLLLETKSVVQFALLFGTTWVNNSLVFLGVLTLVLAANWTATLVPVGWVKGVFGFLLGTCLLGVIYPLGNLLAVESVPLRFVLASLLTFSPIFAANLLFSIAFRDQAVAEHVFGWNLLGATLGGVVEYFSLALGYTALAWLVAVCYSVAFVALLAGLGGSSAGASSDADTIASEGQSASSDEPPSASAQGTQIAPQ
jgi:hypothetical protein